ncbi:MAG: fimbrillin family protein [bacterium]|nr:fimbrillin family protein [bacterium]
MREFKFLFAFLLLCSAAACQKSDVAPEERKPFAFAASEETKTGLSETYDNFRVWATIVQGSSLSTEMPGYLVKHDNALGWSYENIDDQELKYWSGSADAYHFHAGAPDYVENGSEEQVAGIVRNAGTPATPAITENSLTLKMIATKEIKETSLYSQPYLVRRTDPSFGSLVNLKFCYAHAKVNVAFKYVSGSTITIKEIKLTPPAAIATEATLQINYDWAKPAVSAGTLDIGISTSSPLEFNQIENISANSKEYHSSSPWYLIPDPASKGDWKLSITVASEGVADVTKQVTFTVSKAWESGKAYLYRFEYTDEAHLVFLGASEYLFIGENLQGGGEHNFN